MEVIDSKKIILTLLLLAAFELIYAVIYVKNGETNSIQQGETKEDVCEVGYQNKSIGFSPKCVYVILIKHKLKDEELRKIEKIANPYIVSKDSKKLVIESSYGIREKLDSLPFVRKVDVHQDPFD